jgi:hypothetical protein
MRRLPTLSNPFAPKPAPTRAVQEPFAVELNPVLSQVRTNFAAGATHDHVLPGVYKSVMLLVKSPSDMTDYERDTLPRMSHSSLILPNEISVALIVPEGWEMAVQEIGTAQLTRAIYQWAEREGVSVLGKLSLTFVRPKHVQHVVQPYLIVRGRICPDFPQDTGFGSAGGFSPTGGFPQVEPSFEDPFQGSIPLGQPRPATLPPMWKDTPTADGTPVSPDMIAKVTTTTPTLGGDAVLVQTDDGQRLRLPIGCAIGRQGGVLPASWGLDKSSGISAQHFRLDRSGQVLWLSDAGSTNGTFHRSGNMESPLKGQPSVILKPGDAIGVKTAQPKESPHAIRWLTLLPPPAVPMTEGTVISPDLLGYATPAPQDTEEVTL